MSKLTICTFKWGDKYGAEHVRRLHSMLKRNLTIDWEFALITDRPEQDVDAVANIGQAIPLWNEMRDTKYCGVRLRAFGADMAERIAPRFAWVDMDVVITGNVDHIFGRSEPFVGLAPPRPPFLFNGSFVMMDAGVRTHVLDQWNPQAYAETRQYWWDRGVKAGAESDEGWMSRVLTSDEARIGRDDGVRYFKRDGLRNVKELGPEVKLVIMNGRYDPSQKWCQQRCPWILEHWR